MLAALEGNGATPESPAVQTQFNIIKDILDRENMNSYTWWQLLSGKGPSGVLRRMLLGAGMQGKRAFLNKYALPLTAAVSHESDFWYQCYELLHVIYFHQRSRHQ